MELNLIGQRFDRLVVLEKTHKRIERGVVWLCRCDCGNTKESTSNRLRRGHTRSCGCLQNELLSKMSTRHGMTKTHIHNVWCGMIERCRNPRWKYYAGRGIRVCDEWKDFLIFKTWAEKHGYKDGLSIERLDNDKNYCPENCTWIPRNLQGVNKRSNTKYTLNGVTKTLSQWSKDTGIARGTIKARIKYLNWTIEKALTTSI